MCFETFFVCLEIATIVHLYFFFTRLYGKGKETLGIVFVQYITKTCNKQVLKTSWKVSIISLIYAIKMSSEHKELLRYAWVIPQPLECFRVT